MIENSWRRLLLILLLVGASATVLSLRGCKYGLDLEGGTRLVYSVDIEKAKADKTVDADKKDADILAEMVEVITKRIDPQGVKDPSITIAGSNRILIELPGGNEGDAVEIQRRIENLGALEMRMVAYDTYDWPQGEGYEAVPADERKFDLAEEKRRLDEWLKKDGIAEAVKRDAVKAIQKFNVLKGTDEGPKSKWLEWRAMYRKRPTPEQVAGGQVTADDWLYDFSGNAHPSGGAPTQARFIPINMHEVYFSGEDLDSRALVEAQGDLGDPAIGYRIKPARAGEYGDQSEKHKGEAHAIILNGEVRIDPVFNERIPGRGQISGGFTSQEVGELIIVLKTGSLSIVPERESSTTVGPSLGHIAIEKGRISIIVGSVLIVLFMLLYYRVAGVVALFALAINVALIFGAMAAIRATLTLPGLAGIVLTIGMAVDANILIFERIREEQDKGKDLQRSVEAGFEKAMSTILDANITTFLTGLILYNVGVGPIKGFAVTLMIGIVSSVFAAVYCGKLFFHWLIAKETISEVSMARLFATPKLRLLSLRKLTAVLSVVMVSLGLIGFFMVPNNSKYGLDFTGGAAFQVALREGMTQVELKDALEKDPYYKDRALQITTLESGEGGKSDRFLIKLKLTPEQRTEYIEQQRAARAEGRSFVPPIVDKARDLLASKLANEPVGDVKTVPISGSASVTELVLHSSTDLDIKTVQKRLEEQLPKVVEVAAIVDGVKNAAASKGKDIFVSFQDEGWEDETKYRKGLPTRFAEFFGGEKPMVDADGKPFQLSSAFPEVSLIGARAVGDLRSAAIGAIILSLLIIVMYIRVRFHEYKYGLGACAALIHDVAITVGIVTVLNHIGVIHAELDLSMIAAFLTIIGYSLNDTIVVFDRIRENLQIQEKLGEKIPFERLIDNSVNQTLSRTVLTSITTFLVVATLFVFNYGAGSTLEGFAFSMMIGIIVGTYSSIWVANPIVLALSDKEAGGTKPEVDETSEETEGVPSPA